MIFNKNNKNIIYFALTFLITFAFVSSYNIDLIGQKLSINTKINNKTHGSELSYYELDIPTTWNNEDLIIESTLKEKKDLISSPLVIISLEPLTSTTTLKQNTERQWICNQLGSEACFLPASYLKPNQKVYLGVLCQSCEYELMYTFAKETKLKLGQNILFHLKKGDKLVFDLTLSAPNDFKDYINISTFNLRMSKYSMKVNIINNKDSKSNVVEAPVTSNWIGGQQSLIKPKNFVLDSGNNNNNLLNYSFKIVVHAEESGVFNIEASSGNTIITLADSNLRFDNTSKDIPMCYYYDNNVNNKTVVDIRSINGDILVYTQADKIPEFDDYYRKFTVNSERDEKLVLDSKENVGKWYLCIKSNTNSYYSIHIYNQALGDKVQIYKKLLYRK